METTYIINRRFYDERRAGEVNEESETGTTPEDIERRSKDRRDGKTYPQTFVLSSESELQSCLCSRHVLYECDFFATFDENYYVTKLCVVH